jgi:hypothetical protein
MSYNSNLNCTSRNCLHNCCSSQGSCPSSLSDCYYYYDAYYCYDACSSTYLYSKNPCTRDACQSPYSAIENSIIGIIVGSALLCMLLTCLVCCCYSKYHNKVEHEETSSFNHQNNNSLATINTTLPNQTIASFTDPNHETEVGKYGKPIPLWKQRIFPNFTWSD